MPHARFFTVPFGQPFALALARFVLNTHTPLQMAKLRIIIPRPRQKEALEKAFFQASGGKTIWPHIAPFETEELAANTLSHTQRLMLLCQLVEAWQKAKQAPTPPNMVLELAQSLAQLFDKLAAHNIPIEKLVQAEEFGLVPTELAHHWQQNLDFISIVLTTYPAWLAEHGKQDPTQSRLTNTFTETPTQPTIIAGFADTTPQGLAMMQKILEAPNNACILPGWPSEAPTGYANLPPAHPCFGMAAMLKGLGVDVEQVKIPILPTAEIATEASEAAWLNSWDLFSPPPHQPKILEAPNQQTEAEAIALMMQETLQHPEKTCALVTPNRAQAATVSALLSARGIRVDDSAGTPLSQTPLGKAFLGCVQPAKFEPLTLLPLLRNPLVHAGHGRGPWQHAVQELEEHLRTPTTKNMAPSLATAQKELPENVVVQTLETLFTPFAALRNSAPLTSWITAHLAVLKTALGTPELPATVDAKKLISLLEKWQEAADQTPILTGHMYKGYLTGLMQTETVRQPWQTGRLFIWGTLEASLQQADTLILGDMNEDTWPRASISNPWINQAMAERLGLPPAESTIGLSAHDFLSLVSLPNTWVTRAQKTADGETAPSRFWARITMQETAQKTKQEDLQNPWLSWVQAYRCQGFVAPAHMPAPAPPTGAAPLKWSASYVRTLMQCPYQAYAKRILRLAKLSPLEADLQAHHFGTLVHACFEDFFTPEKGGWQGPWHPEKTTEMTEVLAHIGHTHFAALPPTWQKVLWEHKWQKIMPDFIGLCLHQFASGKRRPVWVEKEATLKFLHGLTLSARADRVDQSPEGLHVMDYKTGAIPSAQELINGKEPQMPIELLLAQKGAFGAQTHVASLEILKLGKEDPKTQSTLNWQIYGDTLPTELPAYAKAKQVTDKPNKIQATLPDLARMAENSLEILAERFAGAQGAYHPTPGDPTGQLLKKQCEYCDFSALCRFKDWAPPSSQNVETSST